MRSGRSLALALCLLSASLLLQGETAAATSSRLPGGAGDQVWLARYDDFRHGGDRSSDLGVSPDGSTVFVTGYTGTIFTDYGTVAYDAITGDRLWVRRYDGPGHGFDQATSLAVSPDGSTLFVTGFSTSPDGDYDYATVAYETATGIQLWANRYDGPAKYYDYAFSVAASSDGAMVVVTGYTSFIATGDDYATVAYDAKSGTQLWAETFNGLGNSTDQAMAAGLSPDSSLVFVTGYSYGRTNFDYMTIAYDAVTGSMRWGSRYVGSGVDGDAAASLAVSPDGTTLFVTGHSWGVTSMADYATIAYDALTGVRLWTSRYNGPGNDTDIATAIRVSADGAKVFVTGYSRGLSTSYDYATVAYMASTGAELWASRYNGPRSENGYDFGTSVGVSPDGTEVFVTGYSRRRGTGPDYATLAYDSSTGAQLWLNRYNGPSSAFDLTASLGVSPDGSHVFITGSSQAEATGYDYATIAYSA